MKGLLQNLVAMALVGAFPASRMHAPTAQSRAQAAPIQHQNEVELVRATANNEIKALSQNDSLWEYEEVKQQGGKRETYEVVETNKGELYRLIALDGKPLPANRDRAEEIRIRRLISNPRRWQASQKIAHQDDAKERNMLKILPDAFRFRTIAETNGVVEMDAVPNPAFHPSSYEAQVFHHLAGKIWIDKSQKRLVRIDAHLISSVKFGGGLLGSLAQGGTFFIEQKDVGRGHWELTRLDIHMSGRMLLFKTLSVRQSQVDSDFRQVPSALSPQQAAALLTNEKSRVPAS